MVYYECREAIKTNKGDGMKTYGAKVEARQEGHTMIFEVCNLPTKIDAEDWLSNEIKRQKSCLRKVTDHYLTSQIA